MTREKSTIIHFNFTDIIVLRERESQREREREKVRCLRPETVL